MGEMIRVAAKSDVPAGGGIAVDVKGKPVALFNVDGAFFAIDDECTHAGGSLSEGSIDGKVVMCPLHGAEFDLETGAAVGAPAEDPVRAYKVPPITPEPPQPPLTGSGVVVVQVFDGGSYTFTVALGTPVADTPPTT